MVYQTMHLFGLQPNLYLLVFTFCGTVTSYNFHWYLTPAAYSGSYKTNWSVRHRWLHAALFLAGLTGSAWAGWQLRTHWPWLLLTVLITFLYSAPKLPYRYTRQLQRIAVGKTIFLAFAWAHVTALLPLLLAQELHSGKAVFFVVNRFLLIYAVCILFDFRDRDSDRKEGIRSVVTQLETGGVILLFKGIVTCFFLTLPLLRYQGLAWSVLAALSLPAVLLALSRSYSMRQRGDYYYYFLLDGLMAMSVPVVCFL